MRQIIFVCVCVCVCYGKCPVVFIFLLLQIHHHVLKLLDLLAGVATADLAVGHGAVFGGGSEVVEGLLVRTGFLWQRQSGVAQSGVLMKPHGSGDFVLLRRWLPLHLQLPVT